MNSVSFAYTGRILNILWLYWMFCMYISEMWHFNKLLLTYLLTYLYVGQWPIFYGLEDYLIEECHIWYNGSVWHKDWHHKIYIGQWPIFHGPVTLVTLEDYLIEECHTWDNGSIWHKDWPHKIYIGQWLIFHGLEILSYILKVNVRLKLFLDIKWWHQLGVFVPHWALALVWHKILVFNAKYHSQTYYVV